MRDLVWIEISKTAVRHNHQEIRKLIGKNIIMAPCIKANAYGHGMIGIAKTLIENGVKWLSVNSIEEAEILRANKIKTEILIIGYVQLSQLKSVIKTDAHIFVYNKETVDELDKLAKNKKVKVHIKVDTGMSRQGVLFSQFEKFYQYIAKKKNILIEGVATHYATADELDDKIFKKQKTRFEQIYKKYKKEIKYWHAANSAATLLGKNNNFNMVRPGIAIYGCYPSVAVKKVCEKNNIMLKPVLSLKTKVTKIKTIGNGEVVSYGATWKAKQKTKIAVLPIGYYDGLFRQISNKAEVLIKGQRAKILGRICMDIMVVDTNRIKNVNLEDEVVIIGRQGKEEITLEELADKANTINYEITTQLRESLPRIFV